MSILELTEICNKCKKKLVASSYADNKICVECEWCDWFDDSVYFSIEELQKYWTIDTEKNGAYFRALKYLTNE
jgi:hypothetical protein